MDTGVAGPTTNSNRERAELQRRFDDAAVRYLRAAMRGDLASMTEHSREVLKLANLLRSCDDD